MAAVDIISVNKVIDGQTILSDIGLNVERGEFVALVGPSGSGKSTLLRMVAGLESISSGKILINEQCVNQIPASKRNMAMVFQSYALYPHMTVYANMAYGLKMRKVCKSDIQQKVEQAADLLQIKDYLHRKPGELSGGQRQRVAMGRAIVRNPSVFLFDEPLSNLDAKLRTEMRHEIKHLHQRLKTTCLYVTHDQTEAMTLADRVVVLNQGKVEQVGTPKELYRYPASQFVASFIGHYPMNFISARIERVKGCIISQTGAVFSLPSLLESYPYDDVVIGIRSEHLKLTSRQGQSTIHAIVDLVDDMGSDKLVKLISKKGNIPLAIRLFDGELQSGQEVYIELTLNDVNLFCSRTGVSLGRWKENE